MRHGFRIALFAALIFGTIVVSGGIVGVLMAWEVLPDSKLVLLIPVAVVAVEIYVILYAAKRNMRAQFLSREAPSFEQWYQRFYSDEPIPSDVARYVIESVAKGLGGGVEPTQVLPTDRLKEEFAYRLWGTRIDDGRLMASPLEQIAYDVEEFLIENSATPLESADPWETIDDVIRDLSHSNFVPAGDDESA